jgi:hypothetical protein
VFICPQPSVISSQSSAKAVTGAFSPFAHLPAFPPDPDMRKPGAKSPPRRKLFGLKHGFSLPPSQIKKIIPETGNFNFLFRLCS